MQRCVLRLVLTAVIKCFSSKVIFTLVVASTEREISARLGHRGLELNFLQSTAL